MSYSFKFTSLSGSVKRKWQPCGAQSRSTSSPPCAFTMERHSASPRPRLLRLSLTLFFRNRTFQIHAPCTPPECRVHYPPPQSIRFFFFSGCNPDLGSCLCIFYCIVNQVYQYLYNQLCIHAGEQYIFPTVHRNFMFVFRRSTWRSASRTTSSTT